jgi:hypothetical protein
MERIMGLTRLNQALVALFFAVLCALPGNAQNSVTTPTTTLQNDLVVTGNLWPQGNVSTTGNNTVGGTLNVTGAVTLATPLSSGSIAPNVIQHITVPLTAANLIAMYTTPVALIPAGAAGTNILVHKFMFTMTTTATAFTGGGVVAPQIANTAHGAGTLTTATIAAAVVTAAAGTSYTTVIPVSYTGTAATGLFISNQTAAFAAGTGTAIVDVWYSVQ